MKILIPCLAVAFFVGGCQSSGRSARFAHEAITFGTPVQIQPPGAELNCFSSDGSLYAVTIRFPGDQDSFQVRRSVDGRVLFSRDSKIEAVVPILFLANQKELVCLKFGPGSWGHSNLIALDFKTGGVRDLTGGDSNGSMPFGSTYLANSGWTMVAVGNHLVTPGGLVVDIPIEASSLGFTANGFYAYKDNDAWYTVDVTGTVRHVPTPVSLLVSPPLAVRGNWLLDSLETTVSHGTATSVLQSVWMTGPAPPSSTGQNSTAGALVFSGFELTSYGFVPGHDAVYVKANGGSYFVPYTRDPVNPADEPGQ